MKRQRFTAKRTYSGSFREIPHWEVFDQERDPLPDGDPIAAFVDGADAKAFVEMKRAQVKP
jgi:elongation factor P hydroxylase